MMKLNEEQIRSIIATMEMNAEKQVEIFDKELDNVINKLSPEGWTLPYELGIYAVKQIANTNKLDDINTFLKWYFTDEDYLHTKKMVQHIENSSIKMGLKKLFGECWESFKDKRFAICANSLVSVIEGLLSEFNDNKNDIRMMKICQEKVDTFPEDGSTIQKHAWISYNTFIRELYKKSDFTNEEPSSINRHWLLHGRSDYEIEELDCIRLINAVESLCIIWNKENTNNNRGE